MKITLEVLCNVLFNTYKTKDYHEDFLNLNKEKLEILNKVLFKEKRIFFTKETGFRFTTFKKEITDTSFINGTINEILEKNSKEYEIARGYMTANKAMMYAYDKVNIHMNNAIIRSHAEQIEKVYFKMVKDFMMLLYFESFIDRKKAGEECGFFGINLEVEGKDKEILSKRLHVEDYF